MTRITVVCPEALRADANNLAMVLAFGPPDTLTYGALNWQEADGNLYATAWFEVRRSGLRLRTHHCPVMNGTPSPTPSAWPLPPAYRRRWCSALNLSRLRLTS